jgi:peptidoglycan/LPS O-acetylase OafA/YrhL
MPALDGLRGLAVLAVVLYHGGVAGLGGGFLGVDAFFVLSGFLITSLLLVEWSSTGTVSLRRFWERRARRLLPALVVLLLAVVALARWTDQASVVASRGDVAATLAYVQNWHLITAGHGYFAQSALPSSLQHTWSLSIEEQFYLVWPLLLGAAFLAARRRTGGRRAPDPRTRARVLRLLLAATLLAAAASTADMVLRFDPGADPSTLYYGTDTRAGGLLLGASLALALALRADRATPAAARRDHAGMALAGWTGVLAVAVLWVRAEGSSPWLYRGGMALGEVAVVLVIATVVLQPDSVLARVLSWRPLRALGVVSYGVYLWHWPLFALLTASRTGLHGVPLLAARLVVTLVVAAVSLWLVERPLRTGRAPAGAPRALLAAGAAACVVAVVALAPASAVPASDLVAQTTDPDGAEGAAPETGVPPEPTTVPVLPSPSRPPSPGGSEGRSGDGGTATGARAGTAHEVLVVGDSVAKSLAGGLASYVGGSGLHVTDAAWLGCGITVGGPYHYSGDLRRQSLRCAHWASHWRQELARTRPQVAVMLVGRWEVMDRMYDGRWTHVGDRAYDDYLTGQLRQAVAVLSSTGARVVLLTAPYYRRGEQPDGEPWAEDQPERVDRWNALLRAAAAPTGATVVDLDHRTGPHGHYQEVVDGARLRYDGVHFQQSGVRALGPWLLPRLLGPLELPRR